MYITDQQLKAYTELAAYGSPSLRATAHKLGISPQALGKSIIKMEETLGAPLFVRTPVYRPTYVGLTLHPESKLLLEKKKRFLQNVRAVCETNTKRLRITGEFYALCTLSPDAALNNEITLRTQLEDCLNAMSSGNADVVYSLYHADISTGYQFIPIIRDKIKLLLSTEHPLCRKEKLTLDDLAGERLFTLYRGLMPENLAELCFERGFSPQIVSVINMAGLVNALKSGAGVSLFSPPVHEEHNLSGLVYRDIYLNDEDELFTVGFYVPQSWQENPSISRLIYEMTEYRRNMRAYYDSNDAEGKSESSLEKNPHSLFNESFNITESQIRLVTDIAEKGTISGAASRLGYTQQAASKNLAALEEILGFRLFARAAKKVAPTEMCQKLLPLFTKIKYEYDSWYHIADTIIKNAGKTIVIAAESQYLRLNLPPFITREGIANISLISVDGPDEYGQVLDDGMADAFYCMRRKVAEGYEYLPAISSDFYILMSDRHHLASKEALTLKDLFGEKFIAISHEDETSSRLKAKFEEHEEEMDFVFETYNLPLLLKMIRNNMGIMALQPYVLSTIAMDGLVRIPLKETGLRFETGFIVKRGKELSPEMERFISQCRANAPYGER